MIILKKNRFKYMSYNSDQFFISKMQLVIFFINITHTRLNNMFDSKSNANILKKNQHNIMKMKEYIQNI